MSQILVAIDPGAKGAYAVRYVSAGVIVDKFESESDFLTDMKELAAHAEQNGFSITAYIEQVGGFVGKAQPGSSMFNFGRNFGFLLGVCQALSFRVELVRPQVWQKAYPTKTSNSQNATQHKRELKDHAVRLYPQHKVTLANADALLILDYATKQERRT